MTSSMPKQSDGKDNEGAYAEASLESAKKVLQLEADGLKALSDSLNADFNKALNILEATDGRIVVTGMGKSGHVARKIAATLASTGKPALFVHPAEASHGDLGMISEDGDAVIALSNSGETPEMADLVAYTRRFKIPLIAITSRAGSALDEASDVALILPAVEEACPMGLAPTTSTTMMLALGDALAVALLERRGFSADDFQVLHPGGKLGKRLLKISDIMHSGDELPLLTTDATMSEALLVMTGKGLGCIGIVDESGILQGIITDGDLRRHMSDDLLVLAVDAVMTTGAKTITANSLASEALGIMNEKSITNLFVVDEDSRPVGVVHIHDCLRAGVA